MTVRSFARASYYSLVLLLGCTRPAHDPRVQPAAVDNPFPVEARFTLSGRYRFPDGGLKITADPHDVIKAPIRFRGKVRELPPGTYDLYVRAGDDVQPPGRRELEVGLGDALGQLAYDVPTRNAWVGPIRLTSRIPTTSVDLHGEMEVKLYDLWIETAGRSPSFKALPNAAVTPRDIVWLDFADDFERPAWFTPDMRVTLRSRARVAKPLPVSCKIFDYEHREIGSHRFVAPAGAHSEVIPVPLRYGPYLLRCVVGTREYQRVVARVSAPRSFASESLGGHGTRTLLPLIGAGWNRNWDAGGTESFAPPIKTLAVLEGPAAELPELVRVVRARRASVAAWEIFNEPYQRPEQPWVSQHVARVHAIAKVIRREAPGALVLSGGPGIEIPPALGWWKVLGEAGLFEPLDAISVHMYFGRGGLQPLDTDLAFHAYASELRALVDRFAKGKPLWDTESGIGPNQTFYVDRRLDYGYWDNQGFHAHEPVPYRVGAAMLVRLYLAHRWHEMRWFHYHGAASYGNHLTLVDFDESPLPLSIALAQTVRMLPEAHPDGIPALPRGLWGLRFHQRGTTIVALWAVGLRDAAETRALKIELPRGVEARDMFGNPLVPTTIGIAPVLLFGHTKEIERALSTLSIVPH